MSIVLKLDSKICWVGGIEWIEMIRFRIRVPYQAGNFFPSKMAITVALARTVLLYRYALQEEYKHITSHPTCQTITKPYVSLNDS